MLLFATEFDYSVKLVIAYVTIKVIKFALFSYESSWEIQQQIVGMKICWRVRSSHPALRECNFQWVFSSECKLKMWPQRDVTSQI